LYQKVAVIHPQEDAEKVTIIPGKFSQIWLWTRYEVQKFNHPLATYWSLIYFSIEILELKISKSLEFLFSIFDFSFCRNFSIRKKAGRIQMVLGIFLIKFWDQVFFLLWNLALLRKCFAKQGIFCQNILFFLKKSCQKGNKFEFAAFLFPVATAKVN
jgi:hypothetical protein